MGVHEGHRARLKRRFETEGLDGFQPHEALELLLFQTVARRDVNPLAHRLIERFGSLNGVLTAGEDALFAVPGVGARTAALLAFLPAFFETCRARGAENAPVLKNLAAARAYCGHLVEGGAADRLWLMHLGPGGALILTQSLPAPGGHPRARTVVERALKSRAQALVVAAARENAARLRRQELCLDAGRAAFDDRRHAGGRPDHGRRPLYQLPPPGLSDRAPAGGGFRPAPDGGALAVG
jgi:DNA repair protein RadC